MELITLGDNNFVIGVLIFFAVFIVVLGVEAFHLDKEEVKACQELGFEKDSFTSDFDFCEDSQGNLHYIKMECKPWYWVDCTAKLISVGEVRVE